MAILTITFSAPLNVSCQVGDTAYYVDTAASGGFTVNSNNVTEIGTIQAVTGATTTSPTVTKDTTLPNTLNTKDYYVFFSKDNKANLSSLLGYYADVKFKNDSTIEAELYSIGMDTFNSSK